MLFTAAGSVCWTTVLKELINMLIDILTPVLIRFMSSGMFTMCQRNV